MLTHRIRARSYLPYLGVVGGVLLLAGARPADAHFLWSEIRNAPGPTFRLTFSEEPGGETPANLLARIEAARSRTTDGKGLTLKPAGGALAAPLPAGARVAGASQTWGVLDRREQGRGVFLLQYYTKAALDEAGANERVGVHFEVLARRDGPVWVARVLHGARPEVGAELLVLRPGADQPLELKTDEKGEARFTVEGSGTCAIRASAVEDEQGEHEGKPFALKRYYGTLTFPVAAAQVDAAALLTDAHSARATWHDFPGFTAEAVYSLNGKTARGTITVDADYRITYQLGDPELEAALRPSFASLIMHRRGGATPQYRATWRDAEAHPLGRAMNLNDEHESWYRVRDRQILQVNRRMGSQRFTNNVLENEATKAGFLPRAWTVTFYDQDTNAMVRTSTTRVSWTWTGDVFLPATLETVNAHPGGTEVSRLVLRNHRLLK